MIINFCLELTDPWSSVIGSGLQFVGGLITNKTNKKIAQMNNQTQIDMMRENNQFSRDLAFDMFNAENEYNDPSAQKQRLLAAGLNPWSDGSGSPVETNMADGAAPSAAGSTISPMMPTIVNPFEGIGRDFASSVKALAEAKKAGAETAVIEGTMNDLIVQAGLQTVSMREQNKYQQIVNKYADKKCAGEVQKITQECFNLLTDSMLNMKNISVADAEKRLKEEQIKQVQESTKLTEKEKEKLIKDLEIYDARWALEQAKGRSEINNNNASAEDHRASAEDHRASAAYQRALATTEDDMRELRKTAQTIQNDIQFDNKLRNHQDTVHYLATNQERFESLIANLKMAEYERDYLWQKLQYAIKENDTYTADFVLRQVHELLRDGAAFVPLNGPGPVSSQTVTHFNAKGNQTSSTTIKYNR